MRIPRDLSGLELARKLEIFDYKVTRQKGSHMRLSTCYNGEHHVSIPTHKNLRIGTLAGILAAVAEHLHTSKDELLERLAL